MQSPDLPVDPIKDNPAYSARLDQLIADVEKWPDEVLTSHKSASHILHKMVFLADLGFTAADARIAAIVDRVLAHRSVEGLYQVKMNIPKHFGGSGEDQMAWALCDAPLIMYALVKFRVDHETHLKKGIDYLFSTVNENGWPCKCSAELGKFRGPGKKSDPCPVVNLIMLRLASQLPEYRNSVPAHNAINCLLDCWQNSQQIHPYMFYMGTDFRKLKLPFVWYDILNVVHTLSHFDLALADPRFLEMVTLIQNKRQPDGSFIPESVWKSWADWDFGQKKHPSAYMTHIINDLLKRIHVPTTAAAPSGQRQPFPAP